MTVGHACCPLVRMLRALQSTLAVPSRARPGRVTCGTCTQLSRRVPYPSQSMHKRPLALPQSNLENSTHHHEVISGVEHLIGVALDPGRSAREQGGPASFTVAVVNPRELTHIGPPWFSDPVDLRGGSRAHDRRGPALTHSDELTEPTRTVHHHENSLGGSRESDTNEVTTATTSRPALDRAAITATPPGSRDIAVR